MKKNIFKELLVPVLLLIIPSLLVGYFAMYAYVDYSNPFHYCFKSDDYGFVSFNNTQINSGDILNYEEFYNNKDIIFQRSLQGLSNEEVSTLLSDLRNNIQRRLNLLNYKVSINDSSLCISFDNKDFNVLYLDSKYFILNISDIESLYIADETNGAKVRDRVFGEIADFLSDLLNEESAFELMNWITELDNSVYSVAFMRMVYVTVDKPVIYLYPEEPTDVIVSLSGAELTTTYPEYKDGWVVCAYPDGTLLDKNNREYNYLYWEGKTSDFVDLSSGFVVEKGNLISFLESKLSEVGLSDKEACDFISYWLPLINQNNYVLVSFQMENYENAVNLNYSVTPDNELRLFVAFKGLNNHIEIPEQDLSYYKNFKREGFYVVEWGGTLINSK